MYRMGVRKQVAYDKSHSPVIQGKEFVDVLTARGHNVFDLNEILLRKVLAQQKLNDPLESVVAAAKVLDCILLESFEVTLALVGIKFE